MKLKFTAFSFLAVMAFSACTKTELSTSKQAEIVVQAGVAETRVGYEGTSVLPDEFVMDVLQNAGDKYDYKNVVMEKTGDVYTPKSSDINMIWAGTPYTSVDVKAMTLPYGVSSVSAAMDVRVSATQTTESEILKSDVLVATKGNRDVTISNDMIRIDFRHLLSKLDVTFAYGNGLSASNVTVNSMRIENICVGGSYSYESMDFVSSATKVNGEIEMFRNASSPKFEAIFFPYKPTENPKLVVDAVIMGETRHLSCNIVPKTQAGFESGKRYTLKVTVNNNSVTTGSVSIAGGWEIDVNVDPESGDNVFVTE